jgi:hypothetical protein
MVRLYQSQVTKMVVALLPNQRPEIKGNVTLAELKM